MAASCIQNGWEMLGLITSCRRNLQAVLWHCMPIHANSWVITAAKFFGNQSEFGSKVPWSLIISDGILLSFFVSQYTVSSVEPCWDRSVCGRIPNQRLISQKIREAHRRTVDVFAAVEVVEAFLATLGKMCCHVFHKQIHVCSVAASRSFGIIGEVRVCSNFGWFTMVNSREDWQPVFGPNYISFHFHIQHIHISVEVQFVQQDCRNMFASLFIAEL